MNSTIRKLRKIPLINQIAVGLVIGILIAVFLPGAVPVVGIFGDLFVRALKGVAPLLVFILVMNAMVQRKEGGETQMKPIITLYVIGTFAASIVGVTLSFLFPRIDFYLDRNLILRIPYENINSSLFINRVLFDYLRMQ
jgi:serine/threonine transporter